MNRHLARSRLAHILERLKIIGWDLDDVGLYEEGEEVGNMLGDLASKYGIGVCVNCGRYQDGLKCSHCGCQCRRR